MSLLGYVGYRIDESMENGTKMMTAVGLLLGFAVSMYETFKLVKRIEREEENKKND